MFPMGNSLKVGGSFAKRSQRDKCTVSLLFWGKTPLGVDCRKLEPIYWISSTFRQDSGANSTVNIL